MNKKAFAMFVAALVLTFVFLVILPMFVFGLGEPKLEAGNIYEVRAVYTDTNSPTGLSMNLATEHFLLRGIRLPVAGSFDIMPGHRYMWTDEGFIVPGLMR